MEVGRSIPRVDAADKVTGRAKYTDDLCPRPVLEAKILHSTIANGWVKSMDISAAQALPGVVKVLTCFDVPDIQYPTPGHPWSVEKAHQDVSDRKLLNRRVRIYGDDIAAVVAEDEITARRALELIRVEYEEYPVVLEAEQAMAEGAPVLHEEHPDNVLAKMDLRTPMPESDFHSVEDVLACPAYYQFRGRYDTQQVQHCHIENPISYAWMEGGRIVVVTSTQIPHIVRRVIGQAMGIGWGSIRVIKPYIGGGFGNKQEVLYEPLNAWLTTQVGGRCVRLDVSREETFQNTRSRHPISFDVAAAVDGDMRLMARSCTAVSNQGGYASHGHSIVANAVTGFRQLYLDRIGHHSTAYTVYTNRPAPGAMRGYGIPQCNFAVECMMDDIARERGWDPKAFRLANLMPLGYVDPFNGITCHSTGLAECIEKGADFIGWVELREKYKEQSGPVRRGVGMACFSYKTGVYPISLETASARLVLNQDGTVQLHLGATEIGQGGDTVFSQMAAQAIGIPTEDVHIVSFQDTDTAPFDTGAYASRQTYVTGKATEKCALELRGKICALGAKLLGCDKEQVSFDGREVRVEEGENAGKTISLSDIATASMNGNSIELQATVTHSSEISPPPYMVGAAEIEVDTETGEVTLLDYAAAVDCGTPINPNLTRVQAEGGIAQGIGMTLTESVTYDDRGYPMENSLFQYKIPARVDIGKIRVEFENSYEGEGPFGAKSIGEVVINTPLPAISDAIRNAVGKRFYELPITPEKIAMAALEKK